MAASARHSPAVLLFVLGSLMTLAAATPLRAQRMGVAQAFDLERRGAYSEAVDAYRRVLADSPTNVTALLGLERSLVPLGRPDDVIPLVREALRVDSTTGAIYAVGVRAWARVDEPDSLRLLVRRWARTHPGDETPYREWGRALLRRQDRAGAREAYLTGRRNLGQPAALAAELAILATGEGDYAAAAGEWVLATDRLPGYRASALNGLGDAPPGRREEILQTLHADSLATAHRLEAELMAAWGDPVAGYRHFVSTLPDNPVQATQAIRQFLEPLRGRTTSGARLVQGMAYEDLAGRASGPQAARLRLEAARAFAEGGDQASARRMLASLAGDDRAPADLVAGATATLIEVLVAEGKVEEAERRLEEFAARLGSTKRLELRRRVAWGWIGRGDLARAERLVAADSTVDGLAVAGYVALYRGEVSAAIERFRAAGPYADTRAAAVERTVLLAMLQPIEADTLPVLGRGLLYLHQGDTAAAVTRLAQVARRLPPGDGGAELYLLLGKLSRATAHPDAAEDWFRKAAADGIPATAPAAELALGRLLLAAGRGDDAIAVLEHMILTYGDSALLPQARRLLDQARGGVPRT